MFVISGFFFIHFTITVLGPVVQCSVKMRIPAGNYLGSANSLWLLLDCRLT